MNTWYIHPANHLRQISCHLCYARGMAAVSRDVLCLLKDESLPIRDRLQEVVKYHEDGVLYQPRTALPPRRPYLPREEVLRGDKLLLVNPSDEELRHGYILGRRKAGELICEMIGHADEYAAEAAYHHVTAFCEAVIAAESLQ